MTAPLNYRRLADSSAFNAYLNTRTTPEAVNALIADYMAAHPSIGGGSLPFDHVVTGAGTGTGNDSPAIQNKINACTLIGGRVVLPLPDSYYKCDDPLEFLNTSSVQLISAGGGGEPRYLPPTCPLVYTGTGAYFIRIRASGGDSEGNRFEGLDIRHSNAAFTGDLVVTDNVILTTFYRCTFGRPIAMDGTTITARSAINLKDSVTTTILNCNFAHTDYGVIGLRSGSTYATDVTIERCRFAENKTAAILNPHENWNILQNTFEHLAEYNSGRTSGKAGAIICGAGAATASEGLVIKNNGFYDANLLGGTHVYFKGNGLVFTDNFISLGDSATALEINNGGYCFKISGNSVESTGSGATFVRITDAPVYQYHDDNTNLIIGGATALVGATNINYTNGTFAEVQSQRLVATGQDVGAILAVSDNGYGSGANCGLVTGSKTTCGTINFHQDAASTANLRLVLVYFQGDSSAKTPKTVSITPANGASAALGANALYVDQALGDIVAGGFNVRGGATVPAGTYKFFYVAHF